MSVEVITTISPSTNEPILTRNGASAADLELLPDVATEAFNSFRKTTLKERQEIVKKFLKGLAAEQDSLGEELTVQMGRPIAYTAKEVATAIKRAEYLLKISDEALQDTDGEAEKGFKRFIRKVPIGPVLVIFAWNVSFLCFTVPAQKVLRRLNILCSILTSSSSTLSFLRSSLVTQSFSSLRLKHRPSSNA